jgi:hypothetical protein
MSLVTVVVAPYLCRQTEKNHVALCNLSDAVFFKLRCNWTGGITRSYGRDLRPRLGVKWPRDRIPAGCRFRRGMHVGANSEVWSSCRLRKTLRFGRSYQHQYRHRRAEALQRRTASAVRVSSSSRRFRAGSHSRSADALELCPRSWRGGRHSAHGQTCVARDPSGCDSYSWVRNRKSVVGVCFSLRALEARKRLATD